MLCGRRTKSDTACRKSCLNGRDHCIWHGPKCQGIKHSGGNCGARAIGRLNWLYCCDLHVPNNTVTKPEQFRIDNLAKDRRSAVLEYRDHKDAYTGKKFPNPKESVGVDIIVPRRRGIEMDHVVELHVFRDCFDRIPKHGLRFEEEKKELLDFMRENVVNQTENLNLTTSEINEIKFRAIYEFQEDFKNGLSAVDEQGLFAYLDRANSKTTGRKFMRQTSRNIGNETKKSMHEVLGCFEEEQGLHGLMVEKLHDNFTAMRLNH